jgi:hypothetical protein
MPKVDELPASKDFAHTEEAEAQEDGDDQGGVAYA